MKLTQFLTSSLLSAALFSQASLNAEGFTTGQIAEIKEQIKVFLLENPEAVEASLMTLQEKRASVRKEKAQSVITQKKDDIFKNDKDPVLGNSTGSQQLVVFLDPFCGHCRSFKKTLLKAIENNQDLKVIIKDFPILGPVAVLGARAMLAAHQQGLYSQMQKMIYKAAPTLNTAEVSALAKTIPGLDLDRFNKDLEGEEVQKHLSSTLALADSIGVSATPTLIIEDQMIEGGLSLEKLEEIMMLLKKAS